MIAWRWIALAFALVAAAIAWPASQRLSLDRSLVKMFSPDDPVRRDFEFLQEKFGVSDLVVFAYRDSSLWSSDGTGLDRLAHIRSELESIEGIITAMDLSKIDSMLTKLTPSMSLLSSRQPTTRPLLDEKNRLAQQLKKLFEGQTHSPSSDLVAIACLLDASRNTHSASGTLADLRSLAQSLPSKLNVPEAMLVGQPVMVEEGFDAIEADGIRLGYFSSVGLMLLILVGFRSLRWALITIAVVQWSLLVTRGLLVGLQWELTMVSSMLTSIVTVIGVATTMHWMLGYRQGLVDGLSPERAMTRSMQQLWRPIAWACVTDAIGFASLMLAKVGPVQDYGRMMALASIVVLVGIFALVPPLALLPTGRGRWVQWFGLTYELENAPGDARLRLWLEQILRFSLRHAKWISVGSIALGLVAVLGTLRLQVETDFIRNFRSDAPLVVAYQAIEGELGGAGVWDVVLPAPKVLTQEYFDWVLQLEQKLRDIKVVASGTQSTLELSQVMSYADADRASKASVILGVAPIEGRLLGMRQAMGPFVDTLVTKDSNSDRFLRIMLRSREQSDATQKEQLIAQVRSEVATAMLTCPVKSQHPVKSQQVVSGYYVLLSQLVASVVADQWRCFAVATLGIWLAMSIALQDFKLAGLAILPNAIPSMCILGWMGWTGMRVNLGAAMIAAVSMGLSVDSSLHYLMRYKIERRRPGEQVTVVEALRQAQSEIGMAVLLSTCALVLGFGSLSLSDFLPTVVFGTTAAISMLGGLVGNLVILPAMVVSKNSHLGWTEGRG